MSVQQPLPPPPPVPKPGDKAEAPRTPNRLILCFDGTGNEFSGNTSDTNVVKLYNKFNRTNPHQMHYYQPGIGTYTAGGSSVNTIGIYATLKKKISRTIDEGFATSFEPHVMAGYRFLMRYYGPGDRIYIFGFSRGAFTARFLARMIHRVGLLSMGNEEMVPFVYKIYQDYENGLYAEEKKASSPPPDSAQPPLLGADESGEPTKVSDNPSDLETSRLLIDNFKNTFCRTEGADDSHGQHDIKVHFLGLFDNVSSVGAFEGTLFRPVCAPTVVGTARHIRHAVAIDERRVKFRAALFAQDTVDSAAKPADGEDIVEVWFPGNHGDVGGGWLAPPDKEKQEELNSRPTWRKIWDSLTTKFSPPKPSPNVTKDNFQQSDISLKWMIDELDNLDGDDHISWSRHKEGFVKGFKENRKDAVSAKLHDVMKFGQGSGWMKVIFWNFLEHLPFLIKRMEYDGGSGKWKDEMFPLNRGGTRDIPPGSKFHPSVLERLENSELVYRPSNDLFFTGQSKPQKLYGLWKQGKSPATLRFVENDGLLQIESSQVSNGT